MPLYEGFPLHHASIKLNYGGEDISKELLEMIKDKIEENQSLLGNIKE